ncbi:MAG: M23 family metallopeptidase [Deltaproteobacteria bacterium]|nr:M23 family metallopeptidase [Deltaproteobacteria bacterium]
MTGLSPLQAFIRTLLGRKAIFLSLLALLTISCSGIFVKDEKPRGVYHRVKSGETLSAIAKAYKVNVQDLAEANNIDTPGKIEADSVIFIPEATQVHDDIVAVTRSEEARSASASEERPAKAKAEPPPAAQRSQGLKTETLTEAKKRKPQGAADAGVKDRTAVARTTEPETASRKPQARPEGAGTETSAYSKESEARGDDIVYDKDRFIWPLKGKVVSKFGVQPGKTYENGIRIAAGEGAAVQAAASGVVIFSASLKNYGETIIIRHADQYATVYAHLGTRTVRGDTRVKRGDRIAFIGKVGEKEEPYLHFEIRHKNKARNPLFFLP